MSVMLRAAPAKVPTLPEPLPFHLPDSSTKLPCSTSWLSRSGGAGGALLVPALLLPSEPTSVLDIRSPSPSSTLSSTLAASSDGGFGSVDESGAVAVSGLFCDGGASDGQSLSEDGSGAPWDADDLRLPDNELAAGAATHPRAGIGQYGGALKTTAPAAAMPHHVVAPMNFPNPGPAPFRSVSGNQVALIHGGIKRQKEAVYAPPGCSGIRCVNQIASPERIVKDEAVADGSLEACVMPYRRKRDREDLLGDVMGGGGAASARASIVSCKTASEWFHPDWSELPSASASPAPAATVTADDKGCEFAWPAAGAGGCGSSAQLDLYEAMQVLYPSGSINSSATSQPTVGASGTSSALMFPNSAAPPREQRLPIPNVPPPGRHLGALLNAPPLLNVAAYGAPAPQFQDLPFSNLRPSLAAYKFRAAPQFSVPNPGSFSAGEATAWHPVEQQRLASATPAYGRHPPPASATAAEVLVKIRAPPGVADRVGRGVQVEELWHAERQLSLAAEAAAHGDIATAQAILARLNQRSSSPKGLQQHHRSPSDRAIFHFKEALARRMVPPSSASSSAAGALGPPPYYSLLPTPADIISKISAYKSFCDASPIPQFAHFMANQAILDATEGEACIHVIDFELGLGGQWASLIQEMAQRSGGGAAPVAELKITTVVGEEALETRLARENLLQFGKEVGLRVQVEAMGIGKLEAAMGKRSAGAVVVNFGIGLSRVAAHFQTAEALLGFLQWLRALSPKVVAVSESEPPFVFPEGSAASAAAPATSQLLEALKFYACVLETLDAAVAAERLTAAALAEVEAQVIAPRIGEAGGAPGGWGALLQKAGFGARRWSVAAEGQAACLAAAAAGWGVAGFSVRKQQEALQLAWHNKPLVSASAWA